MNNSTVYYKDLLKFIDHIQMNPELSEATARDIRALVRYIDRYATQLAREAVAPKGDSDDLP